MALARGYWSVWLVAALSACGGKPDVPISIGTGGTAAGGASSSGGATGMGGRIVDIPDAGAAGQGTGGTATDPCLSAGCGTGQRCELSAGNPSCIDNTCADLTCTATEECQPAVGGGFACISIACRADVECPAARHCDGKKCVDDVCEPDTRTCSGNSVLLCASNGGSNGPAYECGSDAYFTSQCSSKAGASGMSVGCTCEGDWDCPEYTTCEAGTCKGTGVAPTCTLPPARFEDVLPKLEFRWGGTNAANNAATGSAFPWSSQVASTPIVINLDDDNGDGLINELDFPEIVFMSYYGDAPQERGVVRAIHGGGPNKGKDYFALCGTTLWKEGTAPLTDCDPAAGDAESRTAALGRAGGSVAAGDLDGDGKPEIVVPLSTGAIQILDHTGAIITTSAANLWPSVSTTQDWRYPQPAIANLDYTGFSEIVMGNRVLTLTTTAGKLAIDKVFTGQFRTGTMHHGTDEQHHGPTVCLADFGGQPRARNRGGHQPVSLARRRQLHDRADQRLLPKPPDFGVERGDRQHRQHLLRRGFLRRGGRARRGHHGRSRAWQRARPSAGNLDHGRRPLVDLARLRRSLAARYQPRGWYARWRAQRRRLRR
ncbi:MAG: FG-GAP repeat protein [Polyangiaceae bacterium]